MLTQNRYLAYKRGTNHLVYWVTHASNSIVQKLIAAGHEPPAPLNKTGLATVSEIICMSKLIAQHADRIPPLIYRLFHSVIEARAAMHANFQRFTASNPDPEVEKSNASHKHFIDALTDAFEALGGKS